jgi:hypothetical protein
MHFNSAESFLPASVQSFITDAALEQNSGGTWTVVDANPGPWFVADGGNVAAQPGVVFAERPARRSRVLRSRGG